MNELRGKVAVVTGAAGGIGGALAQRLRREGCRLALVDRNADGLFEATGVTAHAMDVSDARAWESLANQVRELHGGADLLVNNAGVTIHGTFAEHSVEDIDRIVDVNLKGVLYGCRAFLPQLAARGKGHIVNVSSLAGRVAFPSQSTYTATKFAVRGFSASLRMELAASGIGVTAVLPGTVATTLLQTSPTYDRAMTTKLATLMLRHGIKPDRVAERILRAVRDNEAELLIGWDARLTATAHALSSTAVYGALTIAFRKYRQHRSARATIG